MVTFVGLHNAQSERIDDSQIFGRGLCFLTRAARLYDKEGLINTKDCLFRT